VKDNNVKRKVSFNQLQKILGATYREPQWLLVMDHNIRIPAEYYQILQDEDKNYGRVVLPSSYSLARYGTFFDKTGREVILDGVVYQYCMKSNPRNIHYAFKLFCGGSVIAQNTGLGSIHTAKQECSQKAADHIAKHLLDAKLQ
jgi:hypothetical protein